MSLLLLFNSSPPAGGGDIAVNLAALNLQTQRATLDGDIQVQTATLQVATNRATISSDVQVGTATLTVTTFRATISADIEVGTAALALQTQQATIFTGEVSVNTAQLSLQTYPASIPQSGERRRKGGYGGLAGVNLRTKRFKRNEIEDQIEQIVEDVIEEVEEKEDRINAQIEGDDRIETPGQDIAARAAKLTAQNDLLVQRVRQLENLEARAAKKQIEMRVNELVRQRRRFFEDEQQASIEAIMAVLAVLESLKG